jgi:hypothetical protein
MPVLSVIFPGIAQRGSIIITNPAGTIRFTREQVRPANASAHPKAVEHPLTISLADFPQGEVRWLDVVAHTDRDYRWFTALVNGTRQGDFSGSIFIWHANEITPVRFDLYNGEGLLVARTNYYNIQAQLVGGLRRPPEDAGAVVTFPHDLAAKISRVVRLDQASGTKKSIPVFIWLDVAKAPIGTALLTLTLGTEGQLAKLNGAAEWKGEGPYGFAGRISGEYADVIGRPTGEKIRIGALLRAWQGECLLAALREEYFSLDQVTDED